MEFHVFPHNAVRAYEDVYLPFGQVGQNLFGLFGGSGARQIFHPCREVGQAFAERVEMLIGKHCGRHQHSHLFVVGHGLECRADGHFGFAETHVAAHKAVHRPWAFHVFLHGSRRCGLVGGVLVDERCLQLVLQVGVGRETEPLLVLSGGIEADEVAGNVLEFALGFLLELVPCAGSEFVDSRFHPLLAAVFGKLVQGVDADENCSCR